MTDAKAYLKRVKLYDTHINNKMEELDRLNAMVRKITQTCGYGTAVKSSYCPRCYAQMDLGG